MVDLLVAQKQCDQICLRTRSKKVNFTVIFWAGFWSVLIGNIYLVPKVAASELKTCPNLLSNFHNPLVTGLCFSSAVNLTDLTQPSYHIWTGNFSTHSYQERGFCLHFESSLICGPKARASEQVRSLHLHSFPINLEQNESIHILKANMQKWQTEADFVET